MGIFYPIYEKNGPREYDYDYSKVIGHKEEYAGLVLDDRERNYHDDSDFYAVVWNEERNEPMDIEYGTTRFATCDRYVKVDATADVRRKFTDWARKQYFSSLVLRDREKANSLEKGKIVKVVRGRKVKHSTRGKIIYMQTVNYGYSKLSAEVKIGIALDDEKDEKGYYKNVVWTYGKNVQIPEDELVKVLKDEYELYAQACSRFPINSTGAQYAPRFI